MGPDLQRRFFSFEKPIPRDALPRLKKLCAKIEGQFADNVEDHLFRTVNIDPGILTLENLTMAAHRDFTHHVYLADGVFAQLTLVWARGKFRRLPWTNDDFCHDEAVDLFERVRQTFELVEDPSAAPTG